jgi:Phage-related lysozyme (muraminidase)
MQPSANGLKLIEVFEQLRLSPYLDTSKIYTVGWGHALTTSDGKLISVKVFGAGLAAKLAANAMQRTFGKQVLTAADADAQLTKDMASRSEHVTKMCAADTTQAQFDAMLSFCFNIGNANFDASSVRRLHNAGKREVGDISIHDLNKEAKAKAATTTMPISFVRWCNDEGKYSLGLFRRRFAELLVYSGWDTQKAFDLVEQFNG